VQSAVAFSKTNAINSRHQHRRGHHGLHKPAFLHMEVFHTLELAEQYGGEQEKARQRAGLF